MCHHMQQKIYQKIRSALVALALLLAGMSGSVLAATPTQEWVARYNGPVNGTDRATAMVVDGAGNVYVTGYSAGTHYDYATVKYAANGNQLWVARYNGPANSSDEATALAVDGVGNVYVTGRSYGSVYGTDYATVKYDANGNQLWVARYNGLANGFDSATALAVDGVGNVYVTGQSPGPGTYHLYVTIKYDTNGNQLWLARYNGPGSYYDHAYALAVDGAGNVYVTGRSASDYVTVKYDTNGNQLWVARYNGPENSSDEAIAIAVDDVGNVYVTGRSYGLDSGTDYDYATVKYDANGNQLWVARYNGPGNYPDVATDLAVDGAGNVYVTGISKSSSTYDYAYATIKYDSNGNRLWVARYNSLSTNSPALAVDGAGNVYVTGAGSGTGADYATVKYDGNGNQLWVVRYNGVGGNDYATALAVDGAGNVYVTGNSGGSGTSEDYATIKYSQSAPADTTPPVISVSQTPLPNLVGWNNSDVTVSFTAMDADSPPATCTVNSVTLIAEGAGQVASTTCTDAAGNSATAGHSVNIDKTAPMLTMPDLASNYTVGSSALISYAAVETLSGLASVSATLDGEPVNSGSTVMLNQLGNHTFTLTAVDMAGNTETRTMQFTVSYAFSGFLSPLTADGRTTFHLGSVIPVKFELFDANGAAVSTAIAHLSLQKLNDGEPVGDPIDATPTSGADSGNQFRYSGGHYMYNLSTKPFSAGTWRIQAALDDGTLRTIEIGLSSR